jgi:hypothetical protein
VIEEHGVVDMCGEPMNGTADGNLRTLMVDDDLVSRRDTKGSWVSYVPDVGESLCQRLAADVTDNVEVVR